METALNLVAELGFGAFKHAESFRMDAVWLYELRFVSTFVFQDAISHASSLAEVERLKGMLQAGQIPGRDLRPDPSDMEEEEEEDYNSAEAHMGEGYGDGTNNGDQGEEEDMEDEPHENGS
ncbi:hypothetical protein ILYODFUR_026403 [Ilyodon furcidens]|uniref:Uncharacterized protein n=1 Tax=Ilyodon furcidens TaxID=33524 RepID=A0ABV0UY35_9TELE